MNEGETSRKKGGRIRGKRDQERGKYTPTKGKKQLLPAEFSIMECLTGVT